jgi:hypothetical protein
MTVDAFFERVRANRQRAEALFDAEDIGDIGRRGARRLAGEFSDLEMAIVAEVFNTELDRISAAYRVDVDSAHRAELKLAEIVMTRDLAALRRALEVVENNARARRRLDSGL